MLLLNYSLLLTALACGCTAQVPFGSRSFPARQEANAAPAESAGYAPAGITPETPFELPTETTTAEPELTYLPPDNSYGPPPTTTPPPAVEEAQQPEVAYGPPHNTYGPPVLEPPIDEVEDDKVLIKLGDGTVIAVANSFDRSRLFGAAAVEQPAFVQAAQVYQRFPQARRTAPSTTEAATVSFWPARLQQARTTNLVLPPNFIYTSPYQTW